MAKKIHPLLLKVRKLIWGTFWDRGISYKDKVLTLDAKKVSDTELQVVGKVQWSRRYQTMMKFDRWFKIRDYDCSCEAFEWYGDCKHLWGMSLYLDQSTDILDTRSAWWDPSSMLSEVEWLDQDMAQLHTQQEMPEVDESLESEEPENQQVIDMLSPEEKEAALDFSTTPTLSPIIPKKQRDLSDDASYLELFDDGLDSKEMYEDEEYKLKVEFSNGDFSLWLFKCRKLNTGKWSTWSKISHDKLIHGNIPEKYKPLMALDRYSKQWYRRSYYDSVKFSEASKQIIQIIQREELLWIHATKDLLKWRKKTSDLVFSVSKTADENFQIFGNISVDGKKLITEKDRAGDKEWKLIRGSNDYRLMTDQKERLTFFESSLPARLIVKVIEEWLVLSREQFAEFQKNAWFDMFLQGLQDDEWVQDALDEVMADVTPQEIVTIRFDETYQYVISELLFFYDENRDLDVPLNDFRYYFSLDDTRTYVKKLDGQLIRRDRDAERSIAASYRPFFTSQYMYPDREKMKFERVVDDEIDEFFAHLDHKISTGMPVQYYEKTKKISTKTVTVAVQVSSSIDRLDTKVQVELWWEKIDEADLILDALSRREKLVTLSDGTLVRLQTELQEATKQLEALWVDLSNPAESYQIQKQNIALLQSTPVLDIEMDDVSKELQERLQNFTWVRAVHIPKTVQATLRPYQKTWFHRLMFLHEYGFSGILADDMWLGKTLQTITLLTKLYSGTKKKKNKSIIICPTSLTYNRSDEFEKFSPGINIGLIRSGNDHVDSFPKWTQILIWSYGIVTNMIEWWVFEDTAFEYIILDESQYIKNPKSKRAKAICSLQSKTRLALSGTPIENNLIELRSVFHFLMPWFLWWYQQFISRWVQWEKRDLKLLSQKVRPFILRRTKEEVLPDLPPKVEEVVYLQMEPKQAALYEKLEKTYKHEILEKIKTEWMWKARFSVLDALLKLRQACLMPSMLKLSWNTVTESSKISYLSGHVEQMVQSWHTLLIFSQFTAFLSHVKWVMEEKWLSYYYLDGSTKAKERQRLVSGFNDGDVQVFIISLKAGGTWLNLVAADYVIHMDPRWNPAVEQQATDRAYRIWQKKTVFVQKLIIKDTIEEKILKLQEEKKKLIDDVFSGDFSGALSEKDISYVFGEE